MWRKGAHNLQCRSESVQRSEKQQSPCEGEGGLKFEKKMLKKKQTIKPTPKKKLGIGSPVVCTFLLTPTQ